MIHLHLSDEDRERLGAPEWLDLDPHSVTGREAAVLQRGFDLEGERVSFPSPNSWRAALKRQDHGYPDWAATTVLVWLALRRHGVMVPLGELDFDLDQLAWKSDPIETDPDEESDPQASEGKDDASAPPPSDSGPSTTSTP